MRCFVLCFALLAPTLAQAAPAADRAATDRATAAKARLQASPAGKIVLRGTQRHGGLDAWFVGKALRLHYDYDPQGDQPSRTSLQTIDLLTSRAYHDMTAPVQGQIGWDGTQAWSTFDPSKAAPRFWALTPYYFVAMPFVLSDPGVILKVVSDSPKAAGLPPADVIKVTFGADVGDAPDDFYYAYFAKDDGRMLALRYVVTYKPFMKPGMVHTPEKLLVYEDLKAAGPLTLARTHRTYTFPAGERGAFVTLATVSKVKHGAVFDESRMVMPANGKVDTSLDKK
ncbi:MAG: hypothetical protein ACI9U2_000118 [Bradymonadia bacterium]